MFGETCNQLRDCKAKVLLISVSEQELWLRGAVFLTLLERKMEISQEKSLES